MKRERERECSSPTIGGTGNAWYNKTSLEGQQQHTSEGLLRIGDRLLTNTWSMGLEE